MNTLKYENTTITKRITTDDISFKYFMLISRCQFFDLSANSKGGALYFNWEDCSISISDSFFSQCKTTGQDHAGGAFYIENITLSCKVNKLCIYQSSIESNSDYLPLAFSIKSHKGHSYYVSVVESQHSNKKQGASSEYGFDGIVSNHNESYPICKVALNLIGKNTLEWSNIEYWNFNINDNYDIQALFFANQINPEDTSPLSMNSCIMISYDKEYYMLIETPIHLYNCYFHRQNKGDVKFQANANIQNLYLQFTNCFIYGSSIFNNLPTSYYLRQKKNTLEVNLYESYVCHAVYTQIRTIPENCYPEEKPNSPQKIRVKYIYSLILSELIY